MVGSGPADLGSNPRETTTIGPRLHFYQVNIIMKTKDIEMRYLYASLTFQVFANHVKLG